MQQASTSERVPPLPRALRLLAGQYIDMAKKHEWGCKVLYRLRYPALACFLSLGEL